jgi:hypothetical protein
LSLGTIARRRAGEHETWHAAGQPVRDLATNRAEAGNSDAGHRHA